jgi:anti-anti-sigma regulatory factor
VDFGASTFCDSAAMDVLVHAAAELRTVGCELEIRSPNRCLRLMGRVLGLSDDLGLPPA